MVRTATKNTFHKRFGSMLKVDCKRLFLSRTFYIILAACLVALWAVSASAQDLARSAISS